MGIFGTIASWVANIRPYILADYHKCFIDRVNALIDDSTAEFPGGTCKIWCQWDLNSSSNSITFIRPPEYYTRMCYLNSPPTPIGRDVYVGFIEPMKQSVDWLRSAVDFAVHSVRQGIWKKRVMDAYVRTCTISKYAREQIWKTCQPPTSAAICRDQSLFEALGIDTKPLFGEEIQMDDGKIDGHYTPVLHSWDLRLRRRLWG